MSHILKDLYIAAGVIFLFGAAIFVHEFGHYWVALKRGLKVEAFAIGFGPKIFAWVKNGIEYSVRWIPAGGFVKLPQMITSSAIEGGAGNDIPPAPPFSKILVAVAGPFMNVVFAFFVATIVYFVGLPVAVNPSIIGYVEPNSPEAALGIHQGDRIVSVNGKPVKSWEEINNITILALTNTVPVVITRGDVSNTYMLKAEVNNLVGLKTLNLDPMDHLLIDGVESSGPADTAHIKANDEVVGFAGVPVSSRQQLINMIQKRGAEPTPLVIKRGNEKLTVTVTPVANKASGKFQIGVKFGLGKDAYEIEHPTPLSQVSDVCQQVFGTITALVHSHESGVKASDLSGPVGIIGVLAVQWSTDYRLALNFLVMLNINLAILNMMPLPVLDGGHILMAIIERIRRKPLEVRIVEYTTTGFAILLISFMAYVTMYDIKRLPLFRMMFNRDAQIEQHDSSTPPPSDIGTKQDKTPSPQTSTNP
ncbi:MAG TPA: RIP metalloprotease RseP [Verrucomicrobiae bacterium]